MSNLCRVMSNSCKAISNSCRKDKQSYREILNSFERGKPDCRKGRNFFRKQWSGEGNSSPALPKPSAQFLRNTTHSGRTDIRSLHEQARSLHDELHATKEELKSEILTSRAEARRDTIDVKATVVRKLKSHEERIDALEDAAGIP